jgi:acetolactate synthase-1/2/3 large subunit
MGAIMRHLDETLPEDAIITTGAGNYTGWLSRYFRFTGARRLLGPTNGAMGYGVPAAIAASVAAPGRLVVSLSGDGCFLMNGQELATAKHYGLSPLFIIVNNSTYGTIRAHQEMHYPGRVSGTDLTNPDFVKLGESYGLASARVAETAEFAPALDRALQAGGGLIEIVLEAEQIGARANLAEIRGRKAAQTAP